MSTESVDLIEALGIVLLTLGGVYLGSWINRVATRGCYLPVPPIADTEPPTRAELHPTEPQ